MAPGEARAASPRGVTGEFAGEGQGRYQARMLRPSRPREVDGGSVVDRRAHEAEPESDVDGLSEAGVLEHRQALIVVHRDHDVSAGEPLAGERGVGRDRAANVDSLRAQRLHRGCDGLDLLVAQVCPPSPACGLSPQTMMRGAGIAKRARRSRAMTRTTSISIVESMASGTSRSGRWVVASATLSPGVQSIMTGRTPPSSSASSSVWPVNVIPASLMMPLCTGAVTSPATASSRHAATAARMLSIT